MTEEASLASYLYQRSYRKKGRNKPSGESMSVNRRGRQSRKGWQKSLPLARSYKYVRATLMQSVSREVGQVVLFVVLT